MDLKNWDPHLYCLQEPHFVSKEADKLKVKEWKKIFCVNSKKRAGVTILIPNNVDVKF